MTQYSFNVDGPSAVGKLRWNPNGTLLSLAITDPFNTQDNQTCTNTYDDLSRLSGNSCGSTWAQTFSYDAFGNISKSGSISWLPNYASPINNQYQAGWQGLNGKVSYDQSGNLLNDTFNPYTWDQYGNLASANERTVTYDALGRMVELSGSQVSQFLYAPNGRQQLANMVGQQLASAFVQLPGGAVAVYYASGLVQYNHSDWLGSARLFSTPSRTATPAMSFAPFGEGYAGGSNYAQFTGIDEWIVSDTENQTGSLSDFPFRHYSPVQGRWISPDPAGMGAADPNNPQSWNRYAYVLNNPLGYVDPFGLYCDYSDHSDSESGFDSSQFDYNSTAGECNDNDGQWVDDAYTQNGADLAGRPQYAVSANATDASTDVQASVSNVSASISNSAAAPVGQITPLNPVQCPATFAPSLARTANIQGDTFMGKVGQTFLGNTFSGMVDLYNSLTSAKGTPGALASLAINGLRQGLPGGGPLSQGLSGVAQDATLKFAFQNLGAQRLGQATVNAAAAAVGDVKIGYDLVAFLYAVRQCTQ